MTTLNVTSALDVGE